MMWFFAALIVLAMGGVAALAAGHGTPMSEVYDDRPDATVPAHGPLSGDDLRRVRFSLAFRGYRMSEVDSLLERLAAERDHLAAYAPVPPVAESPVADVEPPPVVVTPPSEPTPTPPPDGGHPAP